MLRASKRLAALLAVAAMAAVLLAAPAGAKNGMMQIEATGYIEAVSDGVSPAFTADCPGPTDMATYGDFASITLRFVEGNLRGCVYTLVEEYWFSPNEDATPVVYHERGREVFEGTLYDDDGNEIAAGTFETDYQFTGKFADATLAVELHGRCEHPIVSGTDDFADVEGRFDIKDDVVTGDLNLRGHLRLGG